MVVLLWELSAHLGKLTHNLVSLAVLVVEFGKLQNSKLQHEIFVLSQALEGPAFVALPVSWVVGFE